MGRLFAIIFLIFFTLEGLVANERNRQPLILSGLTMGTYYQVTIVGDANKVDQKQLAQDIDSILFEINSTMSTYDQDSVLSQFNRFNKTHWFPVPASIVEIVSKAKKLSLDTNGYFDVTAGPLVNLWGFGPDGRISQTPSRNEIIQTQTHVGYEKLKFRKSPSALKKEKKGLFVDLSAIAKGFAIDQISTHLMQSGFQHFLVEIGGDLRTIGLNAENQPWRIALESPFSSQTDFIEVLEITDLAVATSGSYRNYFEENGRTHSHIIDPHTGKPVEHKLISATVLAKTATEADAVATAIMVLGLEKGLQLAGERNLEAHLMLDLNGELTQESTKDFHLYLSHAN